MNKLTYLDKKRIIAADLFISSGRKGGQSTSPAKVAAARANALKATEARRNKKKIVDK